ncbi:DUF6299 family protein [Nocardia altamirensis]|uniref:DUF6299 family protein n=1 Tax=Nocardia altamirensis TaxID=472158 RepID=UPI00114D1B60|nr:DUF6299 family protein [Nocardia altamirensis]
MPSRPGFSAVVAALATVAAVATAPAAAAAGATITVDKTGTTSGDGTATVTGTASCSGGGNGAVQVRVNVQGTSYRGNSDKYIPCDGKTVEWEARVYLDPHGEEDQHHKVQPGETGTVQASISQDLKDFALASNVTVEFEKA